MEFEDVVDGVHDEGAAVEVENVVDVDEPKKPDVLAKGVVSGDHVSLVVNPQTGKREVVIVDPVDVVDEGDTDDGEGIANTDDCNDGISDDGDGEGEGASSESVKSDTGKVQSAFDSGQVNKQVYTAHELNLALALGSVDESRISPEHAIQYGEFKARRELVRKQQEQAETDRQNELAGKSELELMQEYHTMVDDMAKAHALKELGFSDMDELEAAEFGDDEQAKSKAKLFNNSFDMHRLNILREAQAKAEDTARKNELVIRERQQVATEVKAFLDTKNANEPHFQDILVLMEKRYKKMSREETEDIAEAMEAAMASRLERRHLPILEKYYKDTRVAFYAGKNKVSTVPQVVKKKHPAKVEKPGSGADFPAKKPNPKDLRSMSHMDKTKWFEQFA